MQDARWRRLKGFVMNKGALVRTGFAVSTLALAGCMIAMGPLGSMRGRNPARNNTWQGVKANAPIPLQDEAVAEGVRHMREEEKIARDVYRMLGEMWGTNIFFNITSSEQRHMDAMAVMIDRYDLEDPIVDDTVGVFATPDFAVLYEQLMAKGSESRMGAFQTGALIEELDIYDLRNALVDVRDPVLISVYENLLRGSRNHLRAFARQIYNNGGTYEAQYLTQEEFDEIANSPNEPGR